MADSMPMFATLFSLSSKMTGDFFIAYILVSCCRGIAKTAMLIYIVSVLKSFSVRVCIFWVL